MSKRLHIQKRGEVLGVFGFVVVAGASIFDPIAGGIVAGAYTLLVGLLGYTGKAYGDNESKHPSRDGRSGFIPPEDSPLDGLPTPVAR